MRVVCGAADDLQFLSGIAAVLGVLLLAARFVKGWRAGGRRGMAAIVNGFAIVGAVVAVNIVEQAVVRDWAIVGFVLVVPAFLAIELMLDAGSRAAAEAVASERRSN